MNRLTFFCILAGLAALHSCNKYDFAGFASVTDTHVNERFDASMKLIEAHPVADVNAASEDYEMYLVTDIHYDGTSDRLERFVSACTSDTVAEKVVLCLGDIVSGRDCQSAAFSKLQPLSEAGWRFLNALGNHDTFFREYDKFREFWPLTTYTFKVNVPSGASDLFICLDTAEGSCGTSQRAWLEDQLKAAAGKYRSINVYTHTHFFNTDISQFPSGNFSLEDTYDLMSLFSRYGVTSVLTGHKHHFEHRSFRGVAYYTFNALCNNRGSCYKVTFGKELQLKEINL
ncbi:MAG: metallophosphoesterase [Bacteroidales bacterium]|nr:metallophosphoesterase [Bacteroidales bacterium]